MATGRTTTRYIRFIVGDSGNALREIPVDSVGEVGLSGEVVDVTAYQDAVKNIVVGTPGAKIVISGPLDNTAKTTVAASGATPTLSGSHLVLYDIANDNLPHTLEIDYGLRGYWATGDPVFGLQRATATNTGYTCTKYTVNGEKYSAEFDVMGGVAPAWGTARLTAGS